MPAPDSAMIEATNGIRNGDGYCRCTVSPNVYEWQANAVTSRPPVSRPGVQTARVRQAYFTVKLYLPSSLWPSVATVIQWTV